MLIRTKGAGEAAIDFKVVSSGGPDSDPDPE
jgi:hypothetical protein